MSSDEEGRDSLLAEEFRSLDESWPYFIRLFERGEPIVCECCGISVVQMPEALAADGPSRAYRPAIWEYSNAGPVRKHTLRRCNWWRERGLARRGEFPGCPHYLGKCDRISVRFMLRQVG